MDFWDEIVDIERSMMFHCNNSIGAPSKFNPFFSPQNLNKVDNETIGTSETAFYHTKRGVGHMGTREQK